MISLYKAYVLPHLEYCCPLLLGISKVLKNNIERTNHYAIKTLLNLGNLATYDFCSAMADMDTLEQRLPCNRLFKCFAKSTIYNRNELLKHPVFTYNMRAIWNLQTDCDP